MRMCLILSLVFGVFFAVELRADEWPQYRGPTGDSIIADAPKFTALTVQPVWKIPLGDAFGEFSVADGKAVLFMEQDDDEVIKCMDSTSGKPLWSTRIDKTMKDGNGNGPRSTPTINGKFVYVYSTFMKLVCLNLETGKEVWRKDVQDGFGGRVPGWGNAVSPIVENDLVIVVGGGNGKGIIAFDKVSGELKWSKTNERLTHATPTVASILGTRQVICFMQSGLVSIDPQTGDTLWTFSHPYKTSTAASPVVGGKNGDIVYCSAGYGVGAAACRVSKDGDKWKATELWRTPGKNLSHWSTPAHREGYLYGLFGHNDGKGPLGCLDMETGEVKWTKPGFGSQGAIIRLGDKLLIQTPAGDLVLVAASPDAFKEIARVNILKGKNWTSPVYVNGMIFARNSSARGVTAEGVCLKLN